MSTKTGVAPTRAIAPTVAKNVYGVVITSSPGPMSSAIRHANKASVPEETPTACKQPLYCAIACSHCSTFGPRIKCCDSSTSATAASTSALIVEYCALRSSSGTCIFGFLFYLAVRLASLVQTCWQRCFLVQIQTTQYAGLDFLVAVSALRTCHYSAGIWGVQAVAVAAHPSDLVSRVSNHQSKVGYVLSYHRAGSDECVSPDLNSANDCRIGPNGAASLQTCGFVQRVPVNLRSRISNIRQHTGWPEKYVVLDRHACVDGYIVLDLDVTSYYRAAIDVHVLRDHAALTDSRTLHDVREVPYLRAGSNLRAFINIGGLVYKVRTLLLAILWLERFRSTYRLPIFQTNRFTVRSRRSWQSEVRTISLAVPGFQSF